MESVWIIAPTSVTIHDLRAVLAAAFDGGPVSIGPSPTQVWIEKPDRLAGDDWIETSHMEALEEDEIARIHDAIPDPVYYALHYHGTDVVTQSLRAIASSKLAQGPMLITDGEGWFGTGAEFLERLDEDPEWWDWWRRDAS